MLKPVFLRYISEAFEKRYQQLVKEGDGFEDDRDAYTAENIFFAGGQLFTFTVMGIFGHVAFDIPGCLKKPVQFLYGKVQGIH